MGRIDRPLSRRQLLARGRALAGLGALAIVPAACATAPPPAGPGPLPVPLPAPSPASPVGLGASPFTLGVASGDPLPDGVVLWTRLAPEPLQGGGMPPLPVAVDWQVATDDRMRNIVQRGTETARPELGHAVHVEVAGLQPGRWYWYRFVAAGAESPIGRTRTAPAPDAPLDRLRFAFASCQHYGQGHFSAYHHMARQELDLVVFLGDYIYEVPSWAETVRPEPKHEPITLAHYRDRYALYKSDPDLQAAHALFPWIVTWDDHEVSNDYADDQSQRRDDVAWFLRRRAAAYQAYYEHMPLRRDARPNAGHMQLYRRLRFGDLAEFNVVDDRQYRSHQPCAPAGRAGGNLMPDCAERHDPQRSMLGFAQERWLTDGLDRASVRWNVIAQQLLMAQFKSREYNVPAFWTDAWDGYPTARGRLLNFLAARRPANPVVIGGDIHSHWVTDLKPDFDDPRAPTVATEFVGTSITSRGIAYARTHAALAENPHVKFFDSRKRGYVRCEVTPARWLTDLIAVDNVTQRDAPAATLASFVVENGRPGAIPVAPSASGV
ncbi:MAG: alkaline phosphatase D family protein [Pseudomonadota bacterium]